MTEKVYYQPDPDDFTQVVTPVGPNKRIVVCAANKYGDLIICGARHHDKIMNKNIETLKNAGVNVKHEVSRREYQGFIDQYGLFLTREEAKLIVIANKQPIRAKYKDLKEILFSEDLY